MGLAVGFVLVVVLAVAYLSWTASRLDRLHQRVDTAGAALEAQLVQRASACRTLASVRALPAPVADTLGRRAGVSLATAGLGCEREAAENLLSRQLHACLQAAPTVFVPGSEPVDDLLGAAAGVAFARRFYNDAVLGALDVRQRRLPRLFRLAGHAEMPACFEIDDTLPWESVSRSAHADRDAAPLR